MSNATLSFVVLLVTLSRYGSARVALMLGGRELANNSEVMSSEIGEGGRALMCTTDADGCCINVRDGDWFYPNSSRVPIYGVGWDVYRTRGSGMARLNRRRNAMLSGVFRCEIHDEDNVRRKLYIDVRSLDAPAVIIEQPGDNYVLPGDDVTFYFTVKGQNLVYLWQYSDGSQLPTDDERFEGIQFKYLTIRSVTAFDAGVYQCAVTNSGGTVYSRPALLSVAGPQIIVQPESMLSVDPGEDVVFMLRAVRATRIRWQKDGVHIQDGNKYSGTRSEHLTVHNVSTADEGSYVCVISDNGVDVPSSPATLTLLEPPVIVQEPVNELDVTPGSNVSFSVVVQGLRLSYTWERNLNAIIGKNTSVLNIFEVTLADIGMYRCVVSNKAGTTHSSSAILSIGPPGQVTLLQATTSSTSAVISWELPLYLAGFTVTVYEIKLEPVTYPVDAEFVNVTSTWYEAEQLIPGARYGFEVRAYTVAGAGEWARTEASVSRTFSAIESLIASTSETDLTLVELSWNPLQVPGWNMTQYYLYYTVQSEGSISNHLLQLPGNVTSYSLHLATSNQSLFYVIATISGIIGLEMEGVGNFESEHSNSVRVAFGEAVFQLQFGPVEYCAGWSAEKTEIMELSILSELQEVVTRSHASSPVIQDGVFTCRTAPHLVTYRARVFGLQAIDVVQCIQDWVKTSPTLLIQWYLIDINSNCTTLVTSFNDEECELVVFDKYPQFSLYSNSTQSDLCVSTCLNDCT